MKSVVHPLLNKRITIRLSEEEDAAYRRAAAALNVSPSEYLRLRLKSVAEETVAEQLTQLRLTILDTMPDSASELSPAMLEILLLLRTICPPGAVRSVHNELRRLGCQPWSAAHTETPA